MHPYQMQRLLVERHKQEVLALRRGSLYHAIDRLTRTGRIEVVRVGREGRRPQRTTYRLTAAGERERISWLRQRIASPQQEPLEFMASLNFLVYLTPRNAARQLQRRAAALEARARQLAAALRELRPFVGRINMIESEFLLASTRAEFAWVRGLLDELRSGRLAWDLRRILRETRALPRRSADRGRAR